MTFSDAARTMDTVRLQTLWTRLGLVVEEMAWTIRSTSFSSVLTDSNDFGCLLYDERGRVIAANSEIGGKLGVWHTVVPEVMRLYGDSIQPGDVFITNDPWLAEGHLNDVCVVRPIFNNRRVVGFADAMAHLSDIGGGATSLGRDVFEEGLFVPVVRLFEAGVQSDEIRRMLEANLRFPLQSMSDIKSLVLATQIGERGVISYLEANHLEGLTHLSDEIVSRTERAMRDAISTKMDEEPHSYSITDSTGAEEITVAVTVQRRGSNIDIGFEGSSRESSIGVNCVRNLTYAWTVFAIQAALCPDLPKNEGCFLPVKLRTPRGSIVDPNRGAPLRMKAASAHLVAPAVLGALGASGALAIAEPGSPTWVLRFSGLSESEEPISETVLLNGGTGAWWGGDGIAAVSFPSNAGTTPVEVLERSLPIRITAKSIRRGTGGSGIYRGGDGQEFEFVVLAQKRLDVSIEARRLERAPRGALRGGEGTVGNVLIDGVERRETRYDLREGMTVRLLTPAGGGVGSPSRAASTVVDEGIVQDRVRSSI